MSTSETNKAVVRELFARATAEQYDALGELLGDHYVCHPEGVRGADGLAEMVRGYKASVPDLTVTIDDQFADGDQVATRITLRGRHVTGHDVEVAGLTISRCRDGRIEEEWEIVDVMSLLAQIGQVPETAPA